MANAELQHAINEVEKDIRETQYKLNNLRSLPDGTTNQIAGLENYLQVLKQKLVDLKSRS